MNEVRVTPTEYYVTVMPKDFEEGYLWTIIVEYRGHDRYAVKRTVSVYSKTGKWDYDHIPSERSDDWLDQHLFPLDEALELAKCLAATITVNTRFGKLSAQDALERLGLWRTIFSGES